MKNFRTTVVSILIIASLQVSVANSQSDCVSEEGQIAVYFDVDGTLQRYKDSPGLGLIDEVYVVGEGFPATFVTGVVYKIDYGPRILWVGDIGLPPIVIGSSPTGISMGFGLQPRPGSNFLIQRATVVWREECGEENENCDGPIVVPHPTLGGPFVTRFPDNAVLPAIGARSQTCQHVELDIRPGSCRNPFNVKLWDWAMGANTMKGGVLPIAILGSATVDVTTINPGSVRLEGVPPRPMSDHLADVSTLLTDWWQRASDCVCNDENGDGYLDLTFKFRAQDVAAAIPEGSVGDVIPLTLTGCYDDGMPFSATDCVTVVGDGYSKVQPSGDAALGYPYPNPFNPVTRISYRIPEKQHVHLAVYDVAGRLVEELVNERKGAGSHVVEWHADNMPSGIYFYRLQTEAETIVRRATLLK